MQNEKKKNSKGIVLRAAACKNRELHFSDHLVEFLIFCLKIPLDYYFRKTYFKVPRYFIFQGILFIMPGQDHVRVIHISEVSIELQTFCHTGLLI